MHCRRCTRAGDTPPTIPRPPLDLHQPTATRLLSLSLYYWFLLFTFIADIGFHSTIGVIFHFYFTLCVSFSISFWTLSFLSISYSLFFGNPFILDIVFHSIIIIIFVFPFNLGARLGFSLTTITLFVFHFYFHSRHCFSFNYSS
jgi:hypothetical protein